MVASPASANLPGKRLDSLTSLRFFAAIAVVSSHTMPGFFPQAATKFIGEHWAYQGVSFFFILSGFVNFYAYPTLPQSRRLRFYGSRFIRLFSLHLSVLALMCVLFLALAPHEGFLHQSGTLMDLLGTALLLQA